jgi:hypothetical protein
VPGPSLEQLVALGPRCAACVARHGARDLTLERRYALELSVADGSRLISHRPSLRIAGSRPEAAHRRTVRAGVPVRAE